jgi:site-specific DNA recombinase
VGAIAKGTIDDDEAVALLNPLRAECKRIESDLAAAESHTNVIELHPQAAQRFKENLEDLAAMLTDRDAAPDLQLIGSFRSLVGRNRPTSKGWGGIRDSYPGPPSGPNGHRNRVSSTGGSGGGTRTPDPRIMIPVL